eukprot:comp12508_c0_seq1/m.7480 comp12508_c0_seq1/g.7480  ORF comp12508_c0_seq1/g.7480 comp12508_c0_seq1/m.7480 type:complete len:310 (-) comp12508_c0_seq1:454-1383(-)
MSNTNEKMAANLTEVGLHELAPHGTHDCTKETNEEQTSTVVTVKNENDTSSKSDSLPMPYCEFSLEEAERFKDQPYGHRHMSHRSPWLRACVLGANDGLVSVACLLLGTAASDNVPHSTAVLSGIAGLVAGALSMALGEYVSVASQRDAEKADIKKERLEQTKGLEAQKREFYELVDIYVEKGVSVELAFKVALELSTKRDVVLVHAREELGIDPDELSSPIQASVVSAISFSIGAGLPLLSGAWIYDRTTMLVVITVVSMVGLFIMGVVGAYLGGATTWKGGVRVLVGGTAAMGITFGIGYAMGGVMA